MAALTASLRLRVTNLSLWRSNVRFLIPCFYLLWIVLEDGSSFLLLSVFKRFFSFKHLLLMMPLVAVVAFHTCVLFLFCRFILFLVIRLLVVLILRLLLVLRRGLLLVASVAAALLWLFWCVVLWFLRENGWSVINRVWVLLRLAHRRITCTAFSCDNCGLTLNWRRIYDVVGCRAHQIWFIRLALLLLISLLVATLLHLFLVLGIFLRRLVCNCGLFVSEGTQSFQITLGVVIRSIAFVHLVLLVIINVFHNFEFNVFMSHLPSRPSPLRALTRG